MRARFIKKDNHITKTWSGGETTELFLSPENGRYDLRQFDFRLSSATIDVEKSEFTSLPGYQRIIMTLDHSVLLQHQTNSGQSDVELAPFKAHHFSGEDQTVSYGRCIDFNLIYLPKYEASMTAIIEESHRVLSENIIYAFYVLNQTELHLNSKTLNEKHMLQPGDFVYIDQVLPHDTISIVPKQLKIPNIIEVGIWKK